MVVVQKFEKFSKANNKKKIKSILKICYFFRSCNDWKKVIIFSLYDDHYGLVKSDVVVVEDIADGVASVIVVAKKLVSTEKLVISTFHSISMFLISLSLVATHLWFHNCVSINYDRACCCAHSPDWILKNQARDKKQRVTDHLEKKLDVNVVTMMINTCVSVVIFFFITYVRYVLYT